MRLEIRIAGFGGQGIVLAGRILGHAAVVYENLFAVMTQSYGPEARGGAARSDIVISDEEIDYPKLLKLDAFCAMSQDALKRYSRDLDSGSILIVDNTMVKVPKDLPTSRLYQIPATDIAERLGDRIVANMVMLGALSTFFRIISFESLSKAVSDIITRNVKLNLDALRAGYEASDVRIRPT